MQDDNLVSDSAFSDSAFHLWYIYIVSRLFLTGNGICELLQCCTRKRNKINGLTFVWSKNKPYDSESEN